MQEKSIFESIKHIDEKEKEYWLARELQKVLEYTEYRKILPVINKAKITCENSNLDVNDHFAHVSGMVDIGSKTKRKVQDYKLSRYACYLIVMNCDPRKEVVSLAKTYFAIKTRNMELLERDYENLSEDEKRLYQRSLTKKGNRNLNITAKNAGIKNFDRFHNSGYKGLYNEETANDIAKQKGLRYREDILDNMASEELVDNLFRIVQTESKLKNDNIVGEKEANDVHYTIGKNIREVIIKNGSTLPEKLETPSKSLKEIEKDNKNIFEDIS